jgi:hypothetical protein
MYELYRNGVLIGEYSSRSDAASRAMIESGTLVVITPNNQSYVWIRGMWVEQ